MTVTQTIKQHRATPIAKGAEGTIGTIWIESGDITLFFRSALDALKLGEQLTQIARKRIQIEEIMARDESESVNAPA